MTISSETRRAGPFTGNGATTVFPFAFKVFEKADLQVVRLDVLAVEHILVLDSDYSVALNADQDADPGGTITYPISGSPLPSTETLTVVGALDYLQPTDITNQGGFYPDVVEKSLDRAVILVQQLYELSLRSVRVPVSDSGGSNELPTTDARKGTVLAFDEVTGAPLPGPSIAAVGTVAGNVAAINSVADNIADIGIVVANIDALIGASSFAAVYQGAYAADPTTRNDASPLQPGDLYFNTVSMLMYVYRGVSWIEVSVDIAGATHAAASKATPVDADELPLADSEASFGLKKLTLANLKSVVFNAWGVLIAAGTAKATPVDADAFAMMDSASSNATKTLTLASLKAVLKTYFDTLYSLVTFSSTAENQAGTVTGKVVSPAGIREAFNTTGSAPIYPVRTFCRFDGTGTVSITKAGNVSSITDNGTGDYTANFTVAMNDANYLAMKGASANGDYVASREAVARTASSIRFRVDTTTSTATDVAIVEFLLIG